MPPPLVKSFADKSGKSEAEVEKLWETAKSQTKEQHPDVSEGSDRFYKITVGILKKMLGIKDNLLYPRHTRLLERVL